MADLKDLFWQSSIHKQLIIEYDGGTIENSAIYFEEFELSESICTDSELRFGGCEASSVKVKITNQYPSLKNKWLKVVVVPEGIDEPLVIGEYKVDSDKLTSSRNHKQIIAYDRMYDIVNTDITEWYNGLTFPLTIKTFRNNLFAYLGCEQEEIILPNDEALLRATPFFDMLLAGDVLRDICEINACFGTINRKGLFEYVFLENDASTSITTSYYAPGNLQFEDFETGVIGGIILSQSDTDMEFYYNAEGSNLYTITTRALYFGDNEETINTILATAYSIMSQIKYVPMSLRCIGNPCITCGNRVSITADSGNIETYILERSLSGIQQLNDSFSAEGVEYYAVQQGSTNRVIRSTNNKISELYRNNFYSYTFTNALEYSITEQKETIIEFNVAATANTEVIVLATIPIELDLDGELVIKYYVDAAEVGNTELRQYLHSGKNFVTISNYINMGENDRLTLTVLASMAYRESVERQHEAKIVSFENYISTGEYVEEDIDTTVPTGVIEQWGIKAVLFAKGIAGTSSWDGTINIADEIAKVTLSTAITVAEMEDTVSIGQQTPTPATISDVFAPVKLSNAITILGMTDVVEFAVEESEE